MSEKFEYNYEAPSLEEREEINNIRKQYLPKDKYKCSIERLRYLDNKVKSIPTAISLCFGVIGVLVFGLGLTFFLEWTNTWWWGIPCSLIGIPLMIIAYPIYVILTDKYKAKYGEEILQIFNQLLNENEK